MIGWLQRLLGDRLPEGFRGTLDEDEHEHVLASALAGAGPLVATAKGLWLPADDGHRRVGWHLISKASWADGVLAVVEAEEIGHAGEAVLIADRPAQRFTVTDAGKLPPVVRQRVDGSITSRYRKELPVGGAWFVQRRTPDGEVLQVRADRGSDSALVADIAREAAAKLADRG